MYNKTKKLPVHWTSEIPVRYKYNAIIGELHRAKKIATNFNIFPSNESFVKTFISNLNYFTNEKCKFDVAWNTTKMQPLFPLKDKVDHYSCVIYRGDCSCDQNYIGETVRNAKMRWNEHEDKNSKSEPAKYLKENPEIYLHGPSSTRHLRTFVSAKY